MTFTCKLDYSYIDGLWFLCPNIHDYTVPFAIIIPLDHDPDAPMLADVIIG